MNKVGFLFFIFLLNLSVFGQLDASFSSPDVDKCPENLFTLNATNTSYSTYNWSITGPGGYSSSPTGSSVAIYLTTSGQYTVTLTVANGGPSTSSTQTNYLTVFAKPTISYVLTPTTGCTPLSVNFNGSCTPGSGSLQSFLITTGTGTSSSVEDFSYTYTSAGTFTPSATVTNSFGCFTTQNLSSVTVSQSASLSSPLNPNSICSG
jgi:PKD repeat protein